MANENVLDLELRTFQENKPCLTAQSLGKYVVIVRDKILGVWDTYTDALQAGYESVGPDSPFLVRQIQNPEPVHRVYRGSVVEC